MRIKKNTPLSLLIWADGEEETATITMAGEARFPHPPMAKTLSFHRGNAAYRMEQSEDRTLSVFMEGKRIGSIINRLLWPGIELPDSASPEFAALLYALFIAMLGEEDMPVV